MYVCMYVGSELRVGSSGDKREGSGIQMRG
jgi:hypothetical protein